MENFAINSELLTTLLGLIFLDVVLGIAVAIVKEEFDWKELTKFYKTKILPYILGWFAIELASQLIVIDILPEQVQETFRQFTPIAAFTALVLSLVLGGVFPKIGVLYTNMRK